MSVTNVNQLKRNAAVINAAMTICDLTHQYANKIAGSENSTAKPWVVMSQDEQNRWVAIVTASINNPPRTPEEGHRRWMVSKLKDGWVYGAVADGVLKTHPNLVEFDELSDYEKFKDIIFATVIYNTAKLIKTL